MTKPGKKAVYSEELLSGISVTDVDRIHAIEHSDPHSVLGTHPASIRGKEGLLVRAFHPDAISAHMIIDGAETLMRDSGAGGLFWAFFPGKDFPFAYRLSFQFPDGTTWESETPYRFVPTLGELDLHFIAEGKHYELYNKLGAHMVENEGARGVSFAVWAPNAKRVSVIGDFNNWDGRLFPMRSMGDSGIWELFVPGLETGQLYKYEIKTAKGELRIKTDPLLLHGAQTGNRFQSVGCGGL